MWVIYNSNIQHEKQSKKMLYGLDTAEYRLSELKIRFNRHFTNWSILRKRVIKMKEHVQVFHTARGLLKARILLKFFLSFPSLVDHVLSELNTMTHPSWVALHSMAYSFTELDKAVVHVIRLVSFRCPSVDRKRTCGIYSKLWTQWGKWGGVSWESSSDLYAVQCVK